MHGYPQFSFWIPIALDKICYIYNYISGWLITCITHNINLSFTDRIPQPELQTSNSKKQFHSKLLRKETFRKWLCLELCKGSGEVLNKKEK